MSKLSFYADQWQNTPIATNEYITPEDGQYRVVIEEVKYTEDNTNPMFTFTFVITEGKQKGQKFRKFATLKNENSISYFKRDLQTIGLPVPRDIEELPGITESAAGVLMEVTVRSRIVNEKTYRDVYFDKRLGKHAVPQQPPQQYQPQQPYQTQANMPPQQHRQPSPQAGWTQQPQAGQNTTFGANDDPGFPF